MQDHWKGGRPQDQDVESGKLTLSLSCAHHPPQSLVRSSGFDTHGRKDPSKHLASRKGRGEAEQTGI